MEAVMVHDENVHAFPQKLVLRDATLFFEDGREVALWGVNFQACLYWEQGFRREPLGLPGDADSIKRMTDNGFEDLKRLGCDVLRFHLTPADFADAAGELVENQWLDLLGYTLAKAREYGMYVTLTFLNQMEFTLVEDSFIAACPRKEWLFDATCLGAARTFIRRLLRWKNPYTGICLKDDPVIATWEPVNEPLYINYADMKANPSYRNEFESWVADNGGEFNDWHFSLWRQHKVRTVIDGFHDLLREEGANQPMVWNCNWPRMVDGNRDVFRAIAESKAEIVSFCLYPGQDEVGEPFLDNAADTSKKNYLPFMQHCYDDYDHLGWLTSEPFRHKAKTVYEFETMYNALNTYLHPAMAKLFRSLGAQMATLWTYSFEEYAPLFSGSHLFNLKCTPGKTAGFLVAGEVFRTRPRGGGFSTSSVTEDVFDGFALSYDHDLSMATADGTVIYSGNMDWCPLELPPSPRRIVGRGTSPLVEYSGTGLYFIDIGKKELRVHIMPNARFVRDPWLWYLDGMPVTELDERSPELLRVNLNGWERGTAFRCEGERRMPVPLLKPGLAFEVVAGEYVIEMD